MSVQVQVLNDINRINHAYLLGLRAAAQEDPPSAAYAFDLPIADIECIAAMSTEALSVLALTMDRALVKPAMSTAELSGLLEAPLPLVSVMAAARARTAADA